MKKNGFTLVELLAVIIILTLVITIAFVSVTRVREESLKRVVETKVEQIEQAAILYGQENPNVIKTSCTDHEKTVVEATNYTPSFCVTVTAGVLIDNNFFESSYLDEVNGKTDLINDVTGKSMREDTVIIYRRNNRIYSIIDEVKSNEV
ncbi:MAG TPA: prepilin-type N-terminal cleavage/methylation domain-containing protein [Candidatus Onthocola stercorigallinarum]|nr:prepilin-type N-terminal cleavage/methylation domain-containing protein [Candidatus Onthocola stercorigallinarum]